MTLHSDAPKKHGSVFIISSPSGAGKTTVVNALVKMLPKLKLSISATTRQPRKHERDGTEYFFLTEEEFFQKRDRNEFLESAKVFDNYYGTPISAVQEQIVQGNDVLFDIDWQGAQQIEEARRFRVVKIFLMPPSARTLHSRLRTRAQDSEEVVRRRMRGAKNEITHWNEYDYVLVNVDVSLTVSAISKIIESEKFKRTAQPELFNFTKQICSELDELEF